MGNELVNRNTGEVVHNQVLSPVNLELVVESFQAYQIACEKLLIDSDYQTIQGKKFKKKSAWRKLGTAYCISTEIQSERRDELSTGGFVYHFTVRAIANNGRYAEGVGSCSSDEKGLAKTEHNTRSIAETRATNRAISNLIGAGEVSAEEMPKEDEEEQLRWIAPPENNKKNGWVASPGQIVRLNTIASKEAKFDEAKKHEWYNILFDVKSGNDLGKEAYNYLCDYFLPNYQELTT